MKKKGFTLIELLAVIIILAVIALIATPVVLNLIEKMRIKAAESSAKGYTKAVEYGIMNDGYFNNISFDGEYDVIENTLNVSYQGDGPSEGHFIIENNIVKYGEFCINGYPIKYENSIGKYAPNEAICSNREIVIVEPPGVDSNQICLGNINYDDETNFKIKKVEDLVCISKLSSEGKTFSGKTIMLLSNIDITNSKSYNNSNDTFYGDINGNGTIEGLQIELTTEKGFMPIGSSTTPFSGTFDGRTKTISNLMINRPSDNNIGLFGYINGGKVLALNIESINVTGNQYIGGIVGYLNKGTINEITLNGSVTGNEYAGGVTGYSNSPENKITSILISNINVAVMGRSPGYAGGISSWNYCIVNAVIESGNITGRHGYKVGPATSTGTVYVSTSVTSSESGSATTDGTSYTYYENDMLSGYDGALDTWIGGDNDSSGYYFDYDENGKIVIRSVEEYPITFNLKGEGTETDPYIISNYQDWREATTKVKGDYYFKLNNDIDFKDKKYYSMGSITNYFVGTLDGNNKTISNITMNGTVNSGIIGYNNTGTIKKLNIDTVNVKGYDNIGLIGYNAGGTVEKINTKSVTINANNNVGGVVGYNNSNGKILASNIESINVTGNQYIGGIVGFFNSGTINEITLNGSVTGNEYAGGVIGYSNSPENKITSILISNINVAVMGRLPGYAGGISSWNYGVISAVIESGNITGRYGYKVGPATSTGTVYVSTNVTSSVSGNASTDGTPYSSEDIQDLGYYGSLLYNGNPIIESKYTGDINNTGYYFDYGSDGYIKVVPVGGASNPDEPTPSIEIDPNYTMTNIVDGIAPTCELYYVVPVSNGIRASFSCTDDEDIPEVRSLFDSTTEKSAATFDTIGTLKSGSVSGTTKTVISTWNVNNPISQPTPGTCYYFRYGAKDSKGNFSTYVTNICYKGFSS